MLLIHVGERILNPAYIVCATRHEHQAVAVHLLGQQFSGVTPAPGAPDGTGPFLVPAGTLGPHVECFDGAEAEALWRQLTALAETPSVGEPTAG